MRRLAFWLALLPVIAWAQTTPNFHTGQVPTADQWNGYFGAKADATNGTLNSPALNGTITGSPFFSGAPSFTATGGTTPRAFGDWQADAFNILGFGVGGAVVNRTGASDASGAIQAAITAACALSPDGAVYFPPGTYLISAFININSCTGLRLWAQPGTVTLLADAATAVAPRIMHIIRSSYISIYGLTFDGNSGNSTASNQALLTVNGPSDHITIDSIRCQNAVSTCIIGNGVPGITGSINAQATAGSNSLSFATSIPTGLKAGAYFYTSSVVPEIFVSSASGTTATLSQNLTDTLLNGTGVHFTFAFTTSADVFNGTTTYPTTDTTNLAVGQTIYLANPCLVPGTKITSIVTNTSVTVDTGPLCKISSGSNIAAMVGVSDFVLRNSVFEGPGLVQRNLGTANFTTNGSTASNSTSVTFTCVSASCNPGVGAIPGDTTGASPPTGMPANNLVIDGPSVNSGAGTFTVTFANPTTGIIAGGTSIPFTVGALSGQGFALWFAQGAWFANRNVTIANNIFRHAWSSPVFLDGLSNVLMQGNTYKEDFIEFQSPTVAPSACIAPSRTVNARFVGEYCSGATGNGLEGDHNVGLQIIDSTFDGNGRAGVFLCNGHDLAVQGRFGNNNQWLNLPEIQDYTAVYGGITLNASCTGNQAATMKNILIGPSVSSDTQTTPTQAWGIINGNPTHGTITGLVIDPRMVGTGNTSGNIGFVPALSACGGGSPSLSSAATDTGGVITEGTSATGCVLTFSNARSVAPTCQVTAASSTAQSDFTGVTTSTTAMTITNSNASGLVYNYSCSP